MAKKYHRNDFGLVATAEIEDHFSSKELAETKSCSCWRTKVNKNGISKNKAKKEELAARL